MNHQNQNLKMEKFCIDDLMEELYIFVKKELQNFGKQHVGVKNFNYPGIEKCWVYSDRERLRQIFCNLLDNAVKFTDKGYIFFGYHISASNHINFFVDDTGIGTYNDTDLVMSIAQGLVQQFGGKIDVRETKDAGMSVNFKIACQLCEEFETGEALVAVD
jgi:signal transduction histidine kinase